MLVLLDTFNEHIWIVDSITLMVLALLALQQRQNSSSLMTLTIAIILSGITIKYKILVNTFVSPNTSPLIWWLWCAGFAVFDLLFVWLLYLYYQRFKLRFTSVTTAFYGGLVVAFLSYMAYLQFGPLLFDKLAANHKTWTVCAFYLGTAFIEILAIYIIHQVHRITGITYSLLARTYFLAFLVAANLQVVSFIELYFWQTNHLAGLYQWGLASINISITAVAISVVFLALLQYYRKTSHQGLLWKP